MDGAFIGCIIPWAAPFAPAGYMFCNGQSLPVQQYTALWSLLGTTYGGNTTNFNLPNLNGRFPRGMSHTVADTLGAVGGANTVSLTTANLPAHTHALGAVSGTMPTTLPIATTGNATSKPPMPGSWFGKTGTSNTYTTSGTADTQITGLTVTTTGGLANAGSAAPLPIVPPYQAINFIICVTGYYPTRS